VRSHVRQLGWATFEKRNPLDPAYVDLQHRRSWRAIMLRGIILWLLGVPLVVIILLYLFNVL
jgi:hypothetical protein